MKLPRTCSMASPVRSTPSEITSTTPAQAAEFANCYNPSWGRHKARTKPSVGNHEYHTAGASGYYNYFGAAAGEPSKGYYSYDLGAWHIIALNSMCENVGGCGASSPMVTWLKGDLAANPSSCTLAYWHHPVFLFWVGARQRPEDDTELGRSVCRGRRCGLERPRPRLRALRPSDIERGSGPRTRHKRVRRGHRR